MPKQSKFTPEMIADIRQQYKSGVKQITLAEQYNVRQPTIHKIVKDVERDVWHNTRKIELSEQTQKDIIDAHYNKGKTHGQLALKYNVSTHKIFRVIRAGLRY